MVVPDTSGLNVEGIDFFYKKFLPSDIRFPVGHPIQKVLYVAHPVEKGLYIPFDNSEQELLNDKMHDLSFLLQCLGAEEICISSEKGHSVETFMYSSSSHDGGGAYKAIGVSGGYSLSNSSGRSNHNTNGITIRATFNPTDQPFVPEGIEWLNTEPSWKRLIQQRMQGNMLTYSLSISSKSVTTISSSKIESIRASLRIVFFKLNYEWNSIEESKYTENKETVWRVDVKFRSVEELQNRRKSITPQPKFIDNHTNIKESDLNIGKESKSWLKRLFGL